MRPVPRPRIHHSFLDERLDPLGFHAGDDFRRRHARVNRKNRLIRRVIEGYHSANAHARASGSRPPKGRVIYDDPTAVHRKNCRDFLRDLGLWD